MPKVPLKVCLLGDKVNGRYNYKFKVSIDQDNLKCGETYSGYNLDGRQWVGKIEPVAEDDFLKARQKRAIAKFMGWEGPNQFPDYILGKLNNSKTLRRKVLSLFNLKDQNGNQVQINLIPGGFSTESPLASNQEVSLPWSISPEKTADSNLTINVQFRF